MSKNVVPCVCLCLSVCLCFCVCERERESLGNNCLLSPLSCNLKVKGEWVSLLAPPSLMHQLFSCQHSREPLQPSVHLCVICHVHSFTDRMNDTGLGIVIHRCCGASVVSRRTVLQQGLTKMMMNIEFIFFLILLSYCYIPAEYNVSCFYVTYIYLFDNSVHMEYINAAIINICYL